MKMAIIVSANLETMKIIIDIFKNNGAIRLSSHTNIILYKELRIAIPNNENEYITEYDICIISNENMKVFTDSEFDVKIKAYPKGILKIIDLFYDK